MEDQVTLLYNKAYQLIHLGETDGMIYADDFAHLNKEIYELIQVLWSRQGKTVEEEAQICLSLLMGFSVCMYGNEGDERKRNFIVERSLRILDKLPNALLRCQLLVYCYKYLLGKALIEKAEEILENYKDKMLSEKERNIYENLRFLCL